MFHKFWDTYGYAFLVVFVILFFGIVAWVYYTRANARKKKKAVDIETAVPPTNTIGKVPRVSAGEAECKKVLEDHFKKPFTKCRPDFLRNTVTSSDTQTHNMELDCYNEELRLAVEYNGRQHYEYVQFFHRNREAFYNQKYRDEFKRIKCREHGVTLIEVPYTIPVERIREYIAGTLDSLKIKNAENK